MRTSTACAANNARAKLAGSDTTRTLELLEEHSRLFPRGQLVEEREALAVQALVLANRYDEARARATTFRERWPQSVYLPSVDMTIRSIP